ncbi:MAG TPA: ATP-binding protein [Terriglobia bacterium]|nr:ATP-binding protein [Terriglobia bacterium]
MSLKEDQQEESGARWIAGLLAAPHRFGAFASAVVFFFLYVLVAELSYAFVIPPSSNAVFWLPSGITFSAFVRARRLPQIWPFWLSALFLGQLAVVFRHGVPPFTGITWAVANVLLPVTGGVLSRRFVRGPFNFRSLPDVLTFGALVALSVIPGGVVAGIGSVAGLNTPWISSAISWAASDALGIVLLAPVILSWTTRRSRSAGGLTEAAVLFSSLTMSSFLILLYPRSATLDRLLSFLFFFVAWAAIRFGPRGTSVALLVVDLTQVWAISGGYGPLAGPDVGEGARILNLQILVANVGLLMLLLAAAIEEQRTARMTAESALKSRDEFLSIASHELRTPLTSLAMHVQMFNRLALQGRLSDLSMEKMAELGRISERQLLRFSSLIDELLEVSRIGSGRFTLHREELDLYQLVRNAISRYRLDADSSRSVIRLHGDAGVIGHWDRSRMELVLAQLAGNALKYGAGRPVDITVEQDGGKARLTVMDHGLGISPEYRARIFERFARAESITRFGGLGLGLFIVRRIVEAHGGSIEVESEIGKGSCFKIELPLDAGRAERLGDAA